MHVVNIKELSSVMMIIYSVTNEIAETSWEFSTTLTRMINEWMSSYSAMFTLYPLSNFAWTTKLQIKIFQYGRCQPGCQHVIQFCFPFVLYATLLFFSDSTSRMLQNKPVSVAWLYLLLTRVPVLQIWHSSIFFSSFHASQTFWE